MRVISISSACAWTAALAVLAGCASMRPAGDSDFLYAEDIPQQEIAVPAVGSVCCRALPKLELSPEDGNRKSLRFSLEDGSRKAYVDGVQVWLAEPAKVFSGGKSQVSYADRQSSVLPLTGARTKALVENRALRVMLDPGHGGRDPGAISPDGQTRENELAFDIARRVQSYLKLAGCDVRMTRSGTDEFIPLEERPALAKGWADVFVSVHINSADSKSAEGVETYAQPSVGMASTSQTIPLDMDSAAVRNINQSYPGNKNDEGNIQLAYCIQRRLTGATGLQDRGVRRARFIVLRQSTVPAALVECGYISNSHDRGFMKSADGRERLARGIYQGIADFALGRIAAGLKPVRVAWPAKDAGASVSTNASATAVPSRTEIKPAQNRAFKIREKRMQIERAREAKRLAAAVEKARLEEERIAKENAGKEAEEAARLKKAEEKAAKKKASEEAKAAERKAREERKAFEAAEKARLEEERIAKETAEREAEEAARLKKAEAEAAQTKALEEAKAAKKRAEAEAEAAELKAREKRDALEAERKARLEEERIAKEKEEEEAARVAKVKAEEEKALKKRAAEEAKAAKKRAEAEAEAAELKAREERKALEAAERARLEEERIADEKARKEAKEALRLKKIEEKAAKKRAAEEAKAAKKRAEVEAVEAEKAAEAAKEFERLKTEENAKLRKAEKKAAELKKKMDEHILRNMPPPPSPVSDDIPPPPMPVLQMMESLDKNCVDISLPEEIDTEAFSGGIPPPPEPVHINYPKDGGLMESGDE